jgi:Na+/phosphate symporter
MLFLNIATGVILVLLGMRYVRKGLDRLFGSQLVDWLQQMTNNRYQAFFGGMVAGLIAPSSSAIAMLSVQMLNQTALTAGRMLAVVLGANVGITVSVQLLAFRLQDYSGVFLLTGGIGFLFLTRAIFRGAGQMLLGIGLVFLAMGIIASAGTAAAANADLKLLFGVGDHYPLVVFMGTALLDEIKLMLRTVWMMIWGKNVRLVSKVEEHQRHIEGTQEELKDYLSQISDENLSEEDVDWKFIVLDYSQELTAIGTLIRRDLADAAIRQIQLNQEPSPEDKEELEAFYARTLERIEKAAALLMSRDPRLAEEFIREKEQINVESRRSRKTRLEKPLSVQSASSNVVDMINCLKRINSQLTSIAYAIVRDSTRSGETAIHSRGAEVEEAWAAEESANKKQIGPR